MNHDRRAAGVEERVGAVAQREPGHRERDVADPIGEHLEVRQVAGMRAVRVLVAVLLRRGIEVTARAREIRRVALADGVDVKAWTPGGSFKMVALI